MDEEHTVYRLGGGKESPQPLSVEDRRPSRYSILRGKVRMVRILTDY